jgi:hypothetical protein
MSASAHPEHRRECFQRLDADDVGVTQVKLIQRRQQSAEFPFHAEECEWHSGIEIDLAYLASQLEPFRDTKISNIGRSAAYSMSLFTELLPQLGLLIVSDFPLLFEEFRAK